MQELTARLRVDFGTGRALGPGKIALLEQVQREGSLASAARNLGMSYRRAWLLLQSANQLFNEPLAIMAKGGRGGGGATLTPSGLRAIKAFRSLEEIALRAARRKFSGFAVMAPPATGKPLKPKRLSTG